MKSVPRGETARDRRSLKGTFYPNEQHLFPEPDWAAYFKEKIDRKSLLRGETKKEK